MKGKTICITMSLALAVVLAMALVPQAQADSWSVKSSVEWENSAENDVRITVPNGNIELLGKDAKGWWSMDDETDTSEMTDLTSNNNHGTPQNFDGDEWVSGKFDYGLETKNDDYLTLPTLGVGTGGSDFSMGIWINPQIDSSKQRLFDGRKEGDLLIDQYPWGTDQNTVAVRIDDGSWHETVKVDVSEGVWQHLFVVYDSSSGFTLYLDGSQVDSSSDTSWGSASIPNNRLGGDDYSNAWEGKFDEFQFYSKALSGEQVSRIYNRTSPSSMTGSDLKSGTWTSKERSMGDSEQQVSGYQLDTSIDSGENVLTRLGADTDNSGSIDTWSDWIQTNDGQENYEDQIDLTGYSFQIETELESSSTTSSPSVQSIDLATSKLDETTITVEKPNENGTIKVDGTEVSDFPYGITKKLEENTTIEATENTWTLDYWLVDGEKYSDNSSITISHQYDNTVRAIFENLGFSTKAYNDVYFPGETASIISDLVHPDGRDNLDTTDFWLTLKDPDDNERISNEKPKEYVDSFTSSTSTNDEWTLDSDYSVNDTDERLEYGYSGNYKQTALIDSSTFSDRAELSASTSFNVVNTAEHMTRIVMRYQDENNYVAFYASHDYSVVGIEEIVNGTRNNVETSKPFPTGQYNTMTGSIVDNTATLSFDGAKIIDYEISDITSAGQTGLMTDASEVYYDYFSIGYKDSSISNIDNGYQVSYDYTIPENDPNVDGMWTIETEYEDNITHFGLENAENQFRVIAENISVINDTVTSDNDWAGAERNLYSEVMHKKPSNISETRVVIWNPDGDKIENTVVSENSTLSDRKTYDYYYTPPKQDNSKGTWKYTWYTKDTNDNNDSKTGYFEVDIRSPKSTNRRVERDGVKVENLSLGETGSIKFDVEHPYDKTITDVSLKAYRPDGSTVFDKSLGTSEGGYTYDYEFTNNNWLSGKYNFEVSVSDSDYTIKDNIPIVLGWVDSEYSYYTPINTSDLFSNSRKETIGHTLEVDNDKIDGNRLRIYSEDGDQIDYDIISDKVVDESRVINIEMIVDTTKDYRAYYDTEGSEYTTTSIDKDSIATVENRFEYIPTSDFYDSVNEDESGSHGASIAIGDWEGDGDRERVVVGKAKNNVDSGFHEWYSTFTVVDENDDKEHSEIMKYGDQSGWYSAQMGDVNGDGDNELVCAGYKIKSGDENASAHIGIYDYDGSNITELSTSTWNALDRDNVRTEYFAMKLDDMTGNGEEDIIVGGMVGGMYTDYADNAQVRLYEVSSDDSINFIDNAETGFVGEFGGANDRDRIFSIETGDFGSGKRIVSTGTTRTDEYNIHDHWILAGTIVVYNYDGTNLNREFSHYYTESEDLTEIFGIDVDDVTKNGQDEIITGGNYYDNQALSDVAELRVWDYTSSDTSISLLDRFEEPAQGHSSVLSVKYEDVNNDFENEIVCAGFKNDGDYDKGFNCLMDWDESTSTIRKIQSETWEVDSRPIRDGETDAMEVYTNDRGLGEFITTGRISQTEPVDSYYRIVELGGVKSSQEPSITKKVPTEDVWYRTDSQKQLGRYNISIDGTDYSYYNFSEYRPSDNDIATQWVENVVEDGVTVDYEIETKNPNTSYTVSRYSDSSGMFENLKTVTSDENGTVTFSTTDHSTNEYILSKTPRLENVSLDNVQTDRMLRFDWDFVGGVPWAENNYQIQIGSTQGDNDVFDNKFTTGDSNGISEYVSNLENSKEYYYRVRCHDGGSWTSWLGDDNFVIDILLNALISSHSDGEKVLVNTDQEFDFNYNYSGLENIILENWIIENKGTFISNPSVSFSNTGDYDVTLNIKEEHSVSSDETITLQVVDELEEDELEGDSEQSYTPGGGITTDSALSIEINSGEILKSEAMEEQFKQKNEFVIGDTVELRVTVTDNTGSPVKDADLTCWHYPYEGFETDTAELIHFENGVYTGSFEIDDIGESGSYVVGVSADKEGYKLASDNMSLQVFESESKGGDGIIGDIDLDALTVIGSVLSFVGLVILFIRVR